MADGLIGCQRCRGPGLLQVLPMPVASEYQLLSIELSAGACKGELIVCRTRFWAVSRSPLWHAVLTERGELALVAHFKSAVLTWCKTL
jgi:hypothetical protein